MAPCAHATRGVDLGISSRDRTPNGLGPSRDAVMEHISRHQEETIQESQILATNLYERIDERWYIIHHHGSPVMG